MTDNVAVLQGFTREVTADSDGHTLYLLVKPDTDFDGSFKAWNMDNQEFIKVNGWLFDINVKRDDMTIPEDVRFDCHLAALKAIDEVLNDHFGIRTTWITDQQLPALLPALDRAINAAVAPAFVKVVNS